MFRAFRLSLWWLLCATLSPGAAVFELKNGDRLSGELVGWADNAIIVENAFLGEVVVPLEALVAPPMRPSPVPTLLPPPDPAAEAPVASEAGGVNEAEDEAEGRLPPDLGAPPENPDATSDEFAADPFIVLPTRAYDAWESLWVQNPIFEAIAAMYPLRTWNNNLQIGLSFQRAEVDEEKVDLQFRTEKAGERHVFRFETRYLTGSATRGEGESRSKTTTADRLTGNFRYRFNYVENFFVQSNTSYQRDLVKRIEHEGTETLGIGYRWLQRSRLEGSVTPSLGAGYSEISGEPGQWVMLASLQQDFEYALTEEIKFSQESNFTYAPAENGNYYLNLRARLENRLSQQLSLSFNYDFTYDERVPSEVEPTTQGVSFTLGANF
ncbi:MAG: DUF481 domain-containing protein [Opitutales bacterium]